MKSNSDALTQDLARVIGLLQQIEAGDTSIQIHVAISTSNKETDQLETVYHSYGFRPADINEIAIQAMMVNIKAHLGKGDGSAVLLDNLKQMLEELEAMPEPEGLIN